MDIPPPASLKNRIVGIGLRILGRRRSGGIKDIGMEGAGMDYIILMNLEIDILMRNRDVARDLIARRGEGSHRNTYY